MASPHHELDVSTTQEDSFALDLSKSPNLSSHTVAEAFQNREMLVNEPSSGCSSVTSTAESDNSTCPKVRAINRPPVSSVNPDTAMVQRLMKSYPDSFPLLPSRALSAYPALDPLAMASTFPGVTPNFYSDVTLPGLTTSSLMYMNHLSSRKRKSPSDSSETTKPNVEKEKAASTTSEPRDDTYWDRRRKNNEAAKRSRDARRLKEEEIAMRATYLEQENLKLRAQVAILKNETAKLHYLLYSRSNPPTTT